VKDLSFAVQPGESYGIVGESGSGKSTVLRVLAGLNRDWSGGVAILGQAQPKIRNKAFSPRRPDGLPGPLRLAAP
jgi:peptide/nickel transport system ATP-binding protein